MQKVYKSIHGSNIIPELCEFNIAQTHNYTTEKMKGFVSSFCWIFECVPLWLHISHDSGLVKFSKQQTKGGCFFNLKVKTLNSSG